ncbi:hypothetical protein PHMEG_0008906 [Phytophthora megakarya]|uniref:Uncharacterized protein n=1 Tax=Phytophthora megakarya TaxID=4795 RepID=A0A225WIC1_9STRA|nr:hypothetical protein PHMEG_0008906 [Phytophthora megakarya]
MTKRRTQSRSASTSPSEPAFRGWEWAQASLWSEGKKCGVRMTDTIIFHHNTEKEVISSYLWLFTGKSGTISRKRMSKDGLVPVAKIRERFLQLAGRSDDKSVAVVNYLDGTRALVGIKDFDEILQTLDDTKREGKKIEGMNYRMSELNAEQVT